MKNKKTCFAWILVFCVVLSSFAGCVAEKDSGAFSGESTNDMPESSLNDRIVFSETIEEQNSLQAYHAQIEGFGNMDYYLFVPEQTRDLMPLVVYLHSASGKGDDLSRLTEMDSFPKYLNTGEMGKVEAFVLIPLLPASEKGWAENGKAVSDLIGEIMVSYPIDPGNVSLTGHSIGGTGTWNIAAEYPSLFARIAPLSGGVRVNDRNITALKEVSVWAFVGSEDTVISPNSSKQMVSELKKAQGDAKITVHSGASHEEVPRLTYLDGSLGVLNWLIGASLVQGSVEWTASVSLTASQTGSDEMNMYKNSDFIEKEQPELTEETKRLISRYQKDPGLENYLSLREEVIRNYDAVLARKEAKLAELREETAGKVGGEAKVAEMEEIVQEMYLTYWDRINSSMLRFSDERLLKWKIADAAKYEYIPVMGAGESVYVKRTPVTNEEYALFLRETGYIPPAEWIGGIYPAGEEKYPVTGVSYSDAQAYCAYLTDRDGVDCYRLPS